MSGTGNIIIAEIYFLRGAGSIIPLEQADDYWYVLGLYKSDWQVVGIRPTRGKVVVSTKGRWPSSLAYIEAQKPTDNSNTSRAVSLPLTIPKGYQADLKISTLGDGLAGEKDLLLNAPGVPHGRQMRLTIKVHPV